VTLLEITNAYATLAGQGIRATPTALDFPDKGGKDPLPTPGAAAQRAVSAESAFLITHILRGVMQNGTGRQSAQWGLNEITAGKSGTTDGLRDAWFVGYTPNLVVGVWVGMDDGSSIDLTGAQAALPIWASVMQAAIRRSPPASFAPPPGIVFASVDPDTGRLNSTWCGGGKIIQEAFRAGSEPKEGCGVAVIGRQVEGIFAWIRKLFQ
jgi:membrane carboxypeptidase/penicillin-binding protein